MALTFSAFVAQILALGTLTWLMHRYEISPSERKDKLVVALVLPVLLGLSFIWCAKVQCYLLSDPETQSQSQVDSQAADSADTVPSRNGRWKVGIVTGFWRIFFTTVFMMIISTLESLGSSVTWSCLRDGLLHATTNNAFFINIFATFSSYVLAWISCSTMMQELTFVVPLLFTTLGAATILFGSCRSAWLSRLLVTIGFHIECTDSEFETDMILGICVLLVASQVICSLVYVMRERMVPLAKEEILFIQPFYNSPFIEQFLLLNRKTEIEDEESAKERHKKKTTAKVYVCTTMYRETPNEQKQFLKSLQKLAEGHKKLDEAKRKTRIYEGHIFFDGGVSGPDIGDFALQLLGLLQELTGKNDDDFKQCLLKYETPYGLQLNVSDPLLNPMQLFIHLKDGNKVKRKKRWSQIMYMSYIANHLSEISQRDEGHKDVIDPNNVYILTTDGDVMFEYESVEQLIDLLHRDVQVGAVCGRTHPVGSGPIAWYQMFDYAIGHWFQKAAEHVLGSVMCCPGCFSMFRVKAVKSVLETYSSNVTEATEFLKKDMGEDRWLCTILVEKKWRLEYCAAADNETHCPTSFDEFFNQRRRWIPSTMVNLGQLCSNGKTVAERNDSVSLLFILYQAIMLFSSIINPSTVILIISAGLAVAYGVSEVALVIVLVLVTTGYGIVCLWFSQDVQLRVAKLLTFVFAIMMGAVVIGIVSQAVVSFTGNNNNQGIPPTSNTTAKSSMSDPDIISDIPFSTWYAIGLAAVYLLAAVLHPFEFYCVLHSFWYLLCLPSGYLLLIIYAVCNLHDQKWGTREESVKKETETAPQTLKKWARFLCSWCPCWSEQTEVTSKDVEIQAYWDCDEQTQTEPNNQTNELDETDTGKRAI